ncbi:hypothetical protein [Herminiimonas sp. CN]|uniref:hypothetical protein n=1 Tax=Herminiimonas sp. CN TaxID=1349818 RepID=UPI000556F97F|nr:hypothetical protein [Herminiimonas sp. CN]
MSLKESTGLRNHMLATGSFKTALDGGLLNIYAGPVPATADAALDPTNPVLCVISDAGTGAGLNMEAAAVAGVLQKATTQVWSGTNVASGVATFYRHVAAGDDGLSSTVQARLQGSIAVVGAEINLTSTTLTSGAPQTINYYSVAKPTL